MLQRLQHLPGNVLRRVKAAVAGFRRSRSRSPYGHDPVQVQVVVGVDGVVTADSELALAYVSRHGLSRGGVSCPGCGVLAAKPSQWRKIRQTKWGEAIQCSCGKVLLASPDDDIDLVKPGAKYDEALYHSFHKPAGWQKPIPRIRVKRPDVGDWVYITQGMATVLQGAERVEGPTQDVAGSEGRVIEQSEDGVLLIALAGNSGFGGQGGLGGAYVQIPEDNAYVMIMDSLRPGDLVTMLQGAHVGRIGAVKSMDMRNSREHLRIDLPPRCGEPGLTCGAIIEHVDRYIPDEIDVDALTTGQLPTRT